MATLRITIFLLSILALLPSCILVERVEFTPFEEEEPPPTPSVPRLRSPVNNSYRSSALLGQLRPTFQWESSEWNGDGSIRYELQFSTDRTFTAEVDGVQTTGLSHQPTENLIISSRPPVGARYFWRVRACVEEACSDYSKSWVVNLGRVKRDTNGDGYADVALVGGGRSFNSASNANGNLYVFMGRALTPLSLPELLVQGSGDTWFRTAATIGDFNGDGLADLVAKVTKQDRTDSRIHVYLGSLGLYPDTTPDATFITSYAAAAGDVNGDGYDDLHVHDNEGAKIIFGGTMEQKLLPTGFYNWLAAGDLNGDGYGDLTAYHPSGVAVFFGGDTLYSKTEADVVLRSSATNDTFGNSISVGGDINGDGCADILIGAPNDNTGGDLAGRAYAYLGQRGDTLDTSPDGVFTGQRGDMLGIHVAFLGDLNGDGFDDMGIRLAELSYSITLRGRFLIHMGGPGTSVDTTTDRELAGEPVTSVFGQRVGAGDVNGDGFDDLMIGAPRLSLPDGTASVGRAYVFLGAAGQPLEPNPDWARSGMNGAEFFGDIAAGHTRDLEFF